MTPDSQMVIPSSDIDRINTMRLRPGDTILVRFGTEKVWVEHKRTLLWHGERIAVWSAASRWSSQKPMKWTEPTETAQPCGSYNWQKVDANA